MATGAREAAVDRWSIKAGAGGCLVLVRTHDCVNCCRRKRASCVVCGGTGVCDRQYIVDSDNAEALLQQAAELRDLNTGRQE